MDQKNKLLIILRGVPGSGKSTLAQKIKEKFDGCVCILSTDEYFLKDGEYKFDKEKLGAAHRWNQRRAYYLMKQGKEVLIIDNTNIKKRDYKEYIKYAEELKYEIKQIVVSGTFKSIHGVPQETIENMKINFQPDERFDLFDVKNY